MVVLKSTSGIPHLISTVWCAAELLAEVDIAPEFASQITSSMCTSLDDMSVLCAWC